MIADLLAPPTSDREWFADHGRRQYRFRSARAGEVKAPNAHGVLTEVEGALGVLIKRDRDFRLECHVFDMSEISEPSSLDSEDACAVVWASLERGGFEPSPI